MRGLFFLLMGGAVGAGLAWLWDDQRGSERRDMMRDRFMQTTDDWKGRADEFKGRAESVVKDMEPKVRELRDRGMSRAHEAGTH